MALCAGILCVLITPDPVIAETSAPLLSVKVLTETDAAHAGSSLRVAIQVTVSEGWHINAHEPLDDYMIPTQLVFRPEKGVTVRKVVFPKAQQVRLSFSEEPLAVYEGRFTVGVLLELADDLDPGAHVLLGDLRYQGCTDTVCAPPASAELTISFEVVDSTRRLVSQHQDVFSEIDFDKPAITPAPSTDKDKAFSDSAPQGDWRVLAKAFSLVRRGSGYMRPPAFVAFLDAAESHVAGDSERLLKGRSLWAITLLTLAGGLALNLTPCVLPMIPINIAIIGAGARAGSRWRGLALGSAYGAGMAVLYGGLGVIAVLTTGAFGAFHSSPWLNLAIVVVFVLLALAMFDVWILDFSRFRSLVQVHSGAGGVTAAFVMGAFTALLAGACVAPVVVAVLLLARDLYARGSLTGLFLPFLLGVGVALPWPFAGAGLTFLPKPGPWMTKVRNVLGVVILLFAAYYGRQAYRQFSDRYFANRQAVQSSAVALREDGWLTSLTDGLALAKQEAKPVLIDFWATWCKSCMAMNKTTFKDPVVQARLKDYVKIKYQAERPSESPVKEVLAHYGVVGLPTYVVLTPLGSIADSGGERGTVSVPHPQGQSNES